MIQLNVTIFIQLIENKNDKNHKIIHRNVETNEKCESYDFDVN